MCRRIWNSCWWSQESGEIAIWVTHVSFRRVQWVGASPEANGFQMWKDVVRRMSSFSLTNGKVYIRFKVWNLVQIQPIGNEEFVSASDAVSWRDGASLVQVVSGIFVLNLQSVQTCLGAP
jgi:hypothetical protein